MEFDETTQKKLLRLAILCHSEHLMDRTQLVRAIELIPTVNATNVDQVASQLFAPTLLEELHLRLGRAQSVVAELRGESAPAIAASPLLAITGGSTGYVADTLPTPVEAEVDAPAEFRNDLHVNMTPRILWPVCGIGVCILLYYVISTLISSPNLFTDERRPPTTSAAGSELSDSVAMDGTVQSQTEADAEKQPLAANNEQDVAPAEPRINRVAARANLESALANFVRNDQFDEALQLLNSKQAERSSNNSLLEVGVLLAKGDKESTEVALNILVQPGIANPQNEGWLSAYATALIYANKEARARAIEGMENSSGRAKVRPDVRRAIEWAKARNGASPKELEELSLRSSDFSATSRDHLFLAFSSIANGQNAQLDYHIGKALRKLPSLEKDLDSTLPEWLNEHQLSQFTSALEKVKQTADSN